MATSSIYFGVYAPPSKPFSRGRWKAPLRAWLPVLACCMLFAVESTPYFGADHTSAPLRRMAEALFGYDACVNWEAIHHIIRKTGHFIGYGGFALLCFRGFWRSFDRLASGMSRPLRAFGPAILLTFLVACADEFHQSFLPNRTGQFSDVLLDTGGGMALCFVLFLVLQMVKCFKKARALPAQNAMLPVRG
jgi:VanZ family protein